MPFSPTPPDGLVTLSGNARTVLEKRYLVKDASGQPVEKPEDMFWRVATVVAEADRRYGASDGAVNALAEEFYFLMTQRRFEPNSPTLMNAGRPLGQLSACFVLPVDDAISNGQSGIYDSLRSMALIHQSGGGTGFSFSRLRSRGSMVRSTTGVASGPVSFMELYDASTDAVKQGGTRRGANMGILRVDHPDVLEFIACKEDLTRITNFNISVGITTTFMEAVKADALYDLVDPVTHTVTGQLRARAVWDTMILGAWRTGEPGVFFIDEANRYNPVPHLGAYEATNPCVTGDTLVATTQGLVPIAELCERGEAVPVTLDTRFSAGKVGPAGAPFQSGIKPVFKVVTREGYEIRVTADHRFMTARGWVEAQHLQEGDALHIQNTRGGFGAHGTREEGRVLGWLIADGHSTGSSGYGAVLGFRGDDREVAAAFARDVHEALGSYDGASRAVGVVDIPVRDLATVSSTRLRELVAARHGVTAECKLDRVPAPVLAGGETMQQGFLQALFTADGHVSGTPDTGVSVRLTSISLALLQDVQRMLLNFGIASRIYQERHPARTVAFNGVPSECQADHDLVIARDNVQRFAEEIGFLTRTKNRALIKRLASSGARGPYRETFTARFQALVPAGEEMVYDLTEPLTHSFIGNGFVVHNCGEQPLLAYDVCNLGSVNVGHYVKDGTVDWDAMRSDIALSTHFLDNIIDVNKYPLPEIDALSKRIRRIGLGVMGFADMLVRLGIPYDSPEGVEMGRKVMAFLDVEAKKESERLANQRGAFPEWARSIWGPDETCARDANGQRIRPLQLLRNCNVTTVAPTGTISIIAGCSSGLEPLFAVAFMRNQAGVLMPDVNEDFVAIAKAEGWYSDALMERIARTGSVQHAEVPARWQAVFNTANNISPEYHIRMQAAFQQHCDSAISKTTNFSHAATVDDVRAIYELAYDMKCKGVTVYRDGSRDGQVLSTGATADATAKRDGAPAAAAAAGEAKGESAKDVAALKRELGELQGTIAELQSQLDRTKKALFSAESENASRRGKRSRPEVMRGTTYRKDTPLGTMFVNITEDEKGQPFEVFLNLGKAGGSAMADAEAIGRLISLALRSGISLQEIHRQLRGISSDRAVGLGPNKVLSLPDAVGMALEQWWREKQGVQTDLLSSGPMTQVQGVPSALSPLPTPAAGVPVVPSAPSVGATQPQVEFGTVGGEVFMGTCPDCGSQLEFAEGCVKCHVCGFSECG
ncbi:MAG: LAGLIDADG family homing endonuclease [Gemmatimonadaceae bacterium]|jgi:ribonucleoside-diphosphate reductase alpha chain|nr:ribonucleoside reductase class II [Gemmatimonadota bacterium]